MVVLGLVAESSFVFRKILDAQIQKEAAVDRVRKYILSRVAFVLGGAICAALVIARGSGTGSLSKEAFSAYLFLLVACVATAVALILKGAVKRAAETRRSTGELTREFSPMHIRSQIRRLKVWIIAVNLVLVLGLWESRDDLSLPLFGGVLISLSITAWLMSLVVRLRRIER